MADYILTIPEGTTGGHFVLAVDGEPTGQITAPGTASGVQGALRAVDEGVSATGPNGGPFNITNVSGVLTVVNSELEGTSDSVSVATAVEVPDPSTGGSTTMAGTKFEDLREARGSLIRKAKGGLILVADMDTPMPDKLMADAEGNLIDFKEAGFRTVGWLTKGDGISFSRETETSEVESFGAQEPTRIDITKDTNSAAFTMQESKRTVFELFYGKDLEGLTMDENGEFAFRPDANPETIYRRMIYLAQDGNGENAKFIAKFMPRAMVSETSEQSWSAESELAYGLTVRATEDEELGYALEHRFGGPGWIKLAESMGIPQASA